MKKNKINRIGGITAEISLALYLIKAGICYVFLTNPTKWFVSGDFADGRVKLQMLDALLQRCAEAGLLRRRGSKYSAGPKLTQLSRELPFLAWALLGYNPYLSHLDEFLAEPKAVKRIYPRDGYWIARSSALIGRMTFYRPIMEAVRRLHPSLIVDIGSGDASLLCDLVEMNTDSAGVAIDSNPKACEAARSVANRRDLGDRIWIKEQRAQSLLEEKKIPDEMKGADCVVLGFLLHELLSYGSDFVSKFLHRLSEIISEDGYILVTEAVKDDTNSPFAALFRWIHDLQGQSLPSSKQWQSIFEVANLEICETVPAILPGATLYLLKRRAE